MDLSDATGIRVVKLYLDTAICFHRGRPHHLKRWRSIVRTSCVHTSWLRHLCTCYHRQILQQTQTQRLNKQAITNSVGGQGYSKSLLTTTSKIGPNLKPQLTHQTSNALDKTRRITFEDWTTVRIHRSSATAQVPCQS
jgi:hypothetical protein